MDYVNTIVLFFQDGGIFMYPIVLILAFGCSIALERYLYLRAANRANQGVWNQVVACISKGDITRAIEISTASSAAMGKVLGYGLQRTRTGSRREQVETAMEEGLMEVMPRLEKRTHYLAIFANIATLLGLLGTIIGLIQAFTAVATASPAEKADMLSASISVAMNTTAFGLMVAIPLLLAHALLQTKTTELVDNLEMSAVKVLNMISDRQGRENKS